MKNLSQESVNSRIWAHPIGLITFNYLTHCPYQSTFETRATLKTLFFLLQGGYRHVTQFTLKQGGHNNMKHRNRLLKIIVITENLFFASISNKGYTVILPTIE